MRSHARDTSTTLPHETGFKGVLARFEPITPVQEIDFSAVGMPQYLTVNLGPVTSDQIINRGVGAIFMAPLIAAAAVLAIPIGTVAAVVSPGSFMSSVKAAEELTPDNSFDDLSKIMHVRPDELLGDPKAYGIAVYQWRPDTLSVGVRNNRVVWVRYSFDASAFFCSMDRWFDP